MPADPRDALIPRAISPPASNGPGGIARQLAEIQGEKIALKASGGGSSVWLAISFSGVENCSGARSCDGKIRT